MFSVLLWINISASPARTKNLNRSSSLKKTTEPRECADIYYLPSNAVALFENQALTQKALRLLQFNQIYDSQFLIGKSCVLEICGFSHIGNTPYRNGSCELYINGNKNDDKEVDAPDQIYGHQYVYEVTSTECACNVR